MPRINNVLKVGTPSFIAKTAIIGVDKTKVHQVKTSGLTPFKIPLLIITMKAEIKEVAKAR